MIINTKKLLKPQTFKADICIVGGGVAGIVLANELLDSGKSVIILESGGEHYDQVSQDLYQSEKYSSGFPDPHFSRLRFLGGSSNHWENNTSPYSPIDFEVRDWIPNSGWPIKFSDIEPYYEKAAFYCGTGQDGYNTEYWSKQLGEYDLLAGSEVIETSIAKSSVPPVRFYSKYGKTLKISDKIQVLTYANLVDIDFNQSTKKIESATFKTLIKLNKIKHVVAAEQFIMCLGGIENARMLLIFNDKFNNKLGNQGDCVGRYFMEHPTVRAAHFFTDDPNKFKLYKRKFLGNRSVVGFFQLTEDKLKKAQTINIRIPLEAASNFELSEGISSFHVIADSVENIDIPDNFGKHLYRVINDLDMVMEAASRKSLDKHLFDSADNFAGFQLPMMTEQTPNRQNRVLLGDQKDILGLKKVQIEWHTAQHDKDLVWKSLEIVAQEIGALGLGRLRLMKEYDERVWGSQLGFGQHHMGTTRMATSPETGVVDKDLKVFGCNNLYIGGSSSFSTGSHVPPTLTITAFAIRLANHLKRLD